MIQRKSLKYQDQHGMKNLKNLMDHVLYQIFKILLSISNITQLEKLAYWNLANNTYRHDSRVLHTFNLNKAFRKLLEISPSKFF